MTQPLIGIIMGSISDWSTLEHAASTLAEFGVPFEKRVVSAHRTPELLFEYARSAEGRGLKCLIAGAGGAAHLPGMAASMTPLPVLGVPVESKALQGVDSLLSIVQMPGGVPVATFAIGKPGAINAGLFAVSLLALNDPALAAKLRAFRAQPDRVGPRIAGPTRGLNPPITSGRASTFHSALTTFPPGSSLGIVGGGQLGRMLAREARRKGYRVVVFTDEYPPSPAGQLATREINAPYYDPEALSSFVRDVDVVTLEFENIPACLPRGPRTTAPCLSKPPCPRNRPEPRARKVLPARTRPSLRGISCRRQCRLPRLGCH